MTWINLNLYYMQGECVFESNGKEAESREENYLGILNIQMISLGGIHFVSLGFLYYFDEK